MLVADHVSHLWCCLQDFVSAVMDVDYSPTGREFVAGGYDRSVRIFNFNAGHSREVGAFRQWNFGTYT
jgi:WD40 repeat protein